MALLPSLRGDVKKCNAMKKEECSNISETSFSKKVTNCSRNFCGGISWESLLRWSSGETKPIDEHFSVLFSGGVKHHVKIGVTIEKWCDSVGCV